MWIPLNDPFTFDDPTHEPSTGNVADADSAPTYEVFEDVNDSPVVSGTMVKRTGKLGNYRGHFVCSGAFHVGSWYNVMVTGIVTNLNTGLATTAKTKAAQFRIVAAEVVPGFPPVDVEKYLGVTAPDTFARLGAPAGASVSADILAVKNVLPTALTANGNIKASMVEILTTALTETAGLLAGGFKKFFNVATPAATMDHGVLVDTASTVTNGVTVTTNNDKTGYGLSSTAVQAIWDALTSALTTVGSIGKLIVTNIDAAISSRMSTTLTGDLSATMKTSVGTAVAASAVASVTGNVGGNVTGSVGSLATQAKADVKLQVTDGLNVDTYGEPGQEAPGATVSLAKKLGYVYKFLRNKKTNTSGVLSIFADDASTVDQKTTITDDGTTYTHNEIASGP